MTEETLTPTHLGFILDGNRRWARNRGSIDTFRGHLEGYKKIHEVLEAGFTAGIPYISIYFFSTENWQRDKTEVSKLMKLAMRMIKKDLMRLVEQQIRVRFLGREHPIEPALLRAIREAEAKTAHFTGRTLLVCFNYGGKQEIADAARKCVEDGLKPEEVTDEALAARMYAPDVPPIDMVVRTSGEQRISNFMLWRIAYSEFYFIDKHWPDMTKDDVHGIIEEYNRRQRRFGA
jgi:undecaprenyl diphosphate synthase